MPVFLCNIFFIFSQFFIQTFFVLIVFKSKFFYVLPSSEYFYCNKLIDKVIILWFIIKAMKKRIFSTLDVLFDFFYNGWGCFLFSLFVLQISEVCVEVVFLILRVYSRIPNKVIRFIELWLFLNIWIRMYTSNPNCTWLELFVYFSWICIQLFRLQIGFLRRFLKISKFFPDFSNLFKKVF